MAGNKDNFSILIDVDIKHIEKELKKVQKVLDKNPPSLTVEVDEKKAKTEAEKINDIYSKLFEKAEEKKAQIKHRNTKKEIENEKKRVKNKEKQEISSIEKVSKKRQATENMYEKLFIQQDLEKRTLASAANKQRERERLASEKMYEKLFIQQEVEKRAEQRKTIEQEKMTRTAAEKMYAGLFDKAEIKKRAEAKITIEQEKAKRTATEKMYADLFDKAELKKRAEQKKTMNGQQTAVRNLRKEEEKRITSSAGVLSSLKSQLGMYLSIYQIAQKMGQGFSYLKEMDKSVTTIQMVNQEFAAMPREGLVQEFEDVAQAIGKTSQEVARMSEALARQGLSMEDIRTRTEMFTKIAAVLGENADTITNDMTAMANAFNLDNEGMQLAADTITKLGAVAATSGNEIFTAMQKSAAGANEAGVSLDQLASYITIISETTREPAEAIGNSLKTIMAKFQQIKNKEGEFGKVLDMMTGVGLDPLTFNTETGEEELKDVSLLLEELAIKWETSMTDIQKKGLSSALGLRQINRFSALMKGLTERTEESNGELTRMQELTDEIGASAGEVGRQYEVFNESVEASANRMKNAWQDMFSDAFNSDDMKKFYKALAGLAPAVGDFLQIVAELTRVGIEFATVILSSEAAVKLLISAALVWQGIRLTNWIQSAITSFTAFNTLIKAGIANLTGYTASMATLSIASGGLLLGITALAAGLYYMAGADARAVREREQLIARTKELGAEANNINIEVSEVGPLIAEYKTLLEVQERSADEQARFEELQKEIAKFSPTLVTGFNLQGDALAENVDLMDDYVTQQKQLVKLKLREAKLVGKEQYDLDLEKKIELENKLLQIRRDIAAGGTKDWADAGGVLVEWGYTVEELNQQLVDTQIEMSGLNVDIKEYELILKQLEPAPIQNVTLAIKDAGDVARETLATMRTFDEIMEGTNKTLEVTESGWSDLAKELYDLRDSTDLTAKETERLFEIQDLINEQNPDLLNGQTLMNALQTDAKGITHDLYRLSLAGADSILDAKIDELTARKANIKVLKDEAEGYLTNMEAASASTLYSDDSILSKNPVIAAAMKARTLIMNRLREKISGYDSESSGVDADIADLEARKEGNRERYKTGARHLDDYMREQDDKGTTKLKVDADARYRDNFRALNEIEYRIGKQQELLKQAPEEEKFEHVKKLNDLMAEKKGLLLELNAERQIEIDALANITNRTAEQTARYGDLQAAVHDSLLDWWELDTAQREAIDSLAEDAVKQYHEDLIKSIQEEREGYKKLKEQAQETAEKKIEDINDEIDVLQDKNEELQNTIDKEEHLKKIADQKKKIANMEKERNVRTFRNGQFVYESEDTTAEKDKLLELEKDYEKWKADIKLAADVKAKQAQIESIKDQLERDKKAFDKKIENMDIFEAKAKEILEKANEYKVTSVAEVQALIGGHESAGYTERLLNLNKFVLDYQEIMANMPATPDVPARNVESKVGEALLGGGTDLSGTEAEKKRKSATASASGTKGPEPLVQLNVEKVEVVADSAEQFANGMKKFAGNVRNNVPIMVMD